MQYRALPLRGFTIIELMLAVALVAGLAAVALPSYSSYRTKVRNRQAAQEIGIMSAAIAQYHNDARAYPPDLAAVGMSGRKDPWGQPYVYYNVEQNGRGHARKDKALNPINSDFDLYSIGVDGDTQSQVSNKRSLDDVIRARDGAFLGLAADF